jgi:hypothetical protein
MRRSKMLEQIMIRFNLDHDLERCGSRKSRCRPRKSCRRKDLTAVGSTRFDLQDHARVRRSNADAHVASVHETNERQ